MYQSPFSSFHQPNEIELQRRRTKMRLRSDASYIGALSLALTLVMQYSQTIVVTALIKCGVFSTESLGKPYLGLSNTRYMVFYMAIYSLSLLLPALLVTSCFKKPLFPFAPAKSVPFGLAFFGVLAAVGFCMFANIVNSYFLTFFSDVGLSVPEAPQLMEKTPTSLVLNLFTVAVLPALLEEMIYRGYILRTLRPYGNMLAVIVSSLFFSLMHGNLRQIPFAFMVGLVLGFLYVSTNNIWLPIAVHFANNSISVLMEYFGFFVPHQDRGVFNALVIYGLIAVGAVCALILLLCYGKRLLVRKSVTTIPALTRLSVLFSSPLFSVSLLMYILLLFMEM